MLISTQDHTRNQWKIEVNRSMQIRYYSIQLISSKDNSVTFVKSFSVLITSRTSCSMPSEYSKRMTTTYLKNLKVGVSTKAHFINSGSIQLFNEIARTISSLSLLHCILSLRSFIFPGKHIFWMCTTNSRIVLPTYSSKLFCWSIHWFL